MALKPVLKIKVDELFLRWLSNSDVQVSLRDSLAQLVRGEAVSAPSRSSSHSLRSSPRGGLSSSFVTPTSPKLPSPHSPRRLLHVKKQNGSIGDSLKKIAACDTLTHIILLLPMHTFPTGPRRLLTCLTAVRFAFLYTWGGEGGTPRNWKRVIRQIEASTCKYISGLNSSFVKELRGLIADQVQVKLKTPSPTYSKSAHQIDEMNRP
ncbi:hypothetical protein Btru_039339 [Bulinus truncatus]|nr:hypothetical protein Btru_039339 [Bulinus truncatus]